MSGIDIIGKTNSLHDARELARKNSGNEAIIKNNDGSYSVQKLTIKETNNIESKADANFGPSVVEFSLEKNGKEEIIINPNTTFINKLESKTVNAQEVGIGIAKYLTDKGEKTLKKGNEVVQYIENKGDEIVKEVKKDLKEAINKFENFITPLSGDIKNFFSQKSPVLRSWESNCGPTCGANIAEMFIPGISKGNPNFILKIRDIDGPKEHALTEQEIINGVKIATNGKVKGKVIDTNYKSNEKNNLINDIKKELSKGNLLMLCTGFGKPTEKKPVPSRHYIAIVGIDKNGNLLVSDPYKKSPGSDLDVWTPEQLQDRMNRATKTSSGVSSLTSFEKVK
ncbi:MAG: C39 family peptidase [Candidatus Sericytochromatia bacterium]